MTTCNAKTDGVVSCYSRFQSRSTPGLHPVFISIQITNDHSRPCVPAALSAARITLRHSLYSIITRIPERILRVMASILAILIAMRTGFTAVIVLGSLTYILGYLAIRRHLQTEWRLEGVPEADYLPGSVGRQQTVTF
jgi:hypothetical protein